MIMMHVSFCALHDALLACSLFGMNIFTPVGARDVFYAVKFEKEMFIHALLSVMR